MAKKIVGLIKLQVPAGKANPSPPIGPALGQRGLNIMEFCKAFNAQTQKVEPGLPLPVVITAYADKSFSFIIKTPPTSVLIKKAAGIESGSPRPHTDKVGKITSKQVEEIAKAKMPDLNAADLEAAMRIMEGRGRRSGRRGRSRRAGEGGQDRFRRGDRGAGGDARGRLARPDPGSARPDAEPEGGDGHRRRRGGSEERARGPGAVPRRQGGHRAMHDRPRLVHARAAARQPCSAGGGAEPRQAGRNEGQLFEEALRVEHDGGRRKSRPGIALGAAMTLASAVKDRRSPKCGKRHGLNRAASYADGVPDSRSAVTGTAKKPPFKS